jgi:excisionase family DNA binding protein
MYHDPDASGRAAAAAKTTNPEPAGLTRDLKVREVAEAMSCHVRTVWQLIEEGELDAYRIGKSRRVTRESFDAFKVRHRVEAA